MCFFLSDLTFHVGAFRQTTQSNVPGNQLLHRKGNLQSEKLNQEQSVPCTLAWKCTHHSTQWNLLSKHAWTFKHTWSREMCVHVCVLFLPLPAKLWPSVAFLSHQYIAPCRVFFLRSFKTLFFLCCSPRLPFFCAFVIPSRGEGAIKRERKIYQAIPANWLRFLEVDIVM